MVGIVVLNYRNAEMTRECIVSIKNNTRIHYRIYVVDNCSEDGSFHKLDSWYREDDKVVVIDSGCNGGYSYGNNVGVRLALNDGAQYIVIMNNDVFLLNSAIDIMYKSIEGKKEIAVTGPHIVNLLGENGQLVRKPYTYKRILCSKKPFSLLRKINEENTVDIFFDEEKTLDFFGMVSGCCFMIRSDVFKEIGLFDESFFMYCEEWVISQMITEKGYVTRYNPEARIEHREGETAIKKGGNAFQNYHQGISTLKYIKRYLKCKSAMLYFMAAFQICVFWMKSLSDSGYAAKKNEFIKESMRVIKEY